MSSTETVASAPGKLILLGEYAVLEGAPAVVLAVNRRADVTVSHGVKRNLITAPQVCDGDVPFSLDEARNVEFPGVDPATSVRLGLLAQVISKYGPGTPVHIKTNTASFYDDGIKMGFGSSAATAVAASAALLGAAPDLASLIEIHRATQEGRGSGFDVAASLLGGVSLFRTLPVPDARPLTLPGGLQLLCLWTGQAASTPAFLRGLDGLGSRREAIGALIESAETVAASLDDQPATWVRAVRDFGVALQRFADQTSLPIYAGGHREIAAMAAQSGVAYKPSGAGGGDLGVAVSDDPVAIRAFINQLAHTGVRRLRMSLDPQGLQLTPP